MGIVGGKTYHLIIPAKAGIQGQRTQSKPLWIPAFAGMTEFVVGSENANRSGKRSDPGYRLASVCLSEENNNLL